MIVKYKDYQLDTDLKMRGNLYFDKSALHDRMHCTSDALMRLCEELEKLDKDNLVLQEPWLVEYIRVQRHYIKILETKDKRFQKSRIQEQENKAKRKQALLKLTPEEIKALKL
jgi:hypothetical protein